MRKSRCKRVLGKRGDPKVGVPFPTSTGRMTLFLGVIRSSGHVQDDGRMADDLSSGHPVPSYAPSFYYLRQHPPSRRKPETQENSI